MISRGLRRPMFLLMAARPDDLGYLALDQRDFSTVATIELFVYNTGHRSFIAVLFASRSAVRTIIDPFHHSFNLSASANSARTCELSWQCAADKQRQS